jgi:hypothetical protein
MAEEPQNSDPTPDQPAPERPVQGIEVPGAGDLGLSEGRKGMVVMPANGDPTNLADIFGGIDAAPPVDSGTTDQPSEPPAATPPPPSDSE